MFGFEEWHSALEMKLYLNRLVDKIGVQPKLTAIKFSGYNQYESLILSLLSWLEKHSITIQYDAKMTNVLSDIGAQRKVARGIEWIREGKRGGRDLTQNDLVFLTNGLLAENSTWGRPQRSGRLQFSETTRDTIFTTEDSVRTAMEAVYALLGVERVLAGNHHENGASIRTRRSRCGS
jgi:myosin-crossreactive antigen